MHLVAGLKREIIMEEITIYKFQLEAIYRDWETCHDRMVVQAEKYAENALKGEKDKVVRYGIRD